VQALTNLQPIVYRIHFLDGKTKAIAVDPSETVADALCRVAEKIGLQSTHGWAMYEVSTRCSSVVMTSVFGRRAYAAQRPIYGLSVRYGSANSAISAFQPSGIGKWLSTLCLSTNTNGNGWMLGL